jgi:hypothetical protein
LRKITLFTLGNITKAVPKVGHGPCFVK